MNTLVSYDYSDSEEDDNVVENTPCDNVVKEQVLEEKEINNPDYLQRIRDNAINFKSRLSKKVEYYDENYHMKLESELLDESVDDSKMIPTHLPKIIHKKGIDVSFPKPTRGEVQLLTLDTDFFHIDDDDTDAKYMNPETINLNLIPEQEMTEISTNSLISEGLLTGYEQRTIKRAQNIDISTVHAKKVCMADLTANRPLEIKPIMSGEELSKLKVKPEDEPDKNAKRQHQITWLASKAKEREFELMTTFSDPSFSRSESRNKYGF